MKSMLNYRLEVLACGMGSCGAGVQGFGQSDSNACLYVGSDGERGVLAQKPIIKGDTIVQVCRLVPACLI